MSLDNMWLTDRHRRISETLQRALLPPGLPTIPGVELAVRYWPAGRMVEAGGDFYDVFAIGPQRWAILIGDVCGTGPDAAALTGIARHTVRAAARHGHNHRVVLEWLNEAIGNSDRDRFCTAVYATIEADGDHWRLTTSSAGHPRPIVARRDGAAAPLGQHGSLIGVFPDLDVTITDIDLGPGDTVVLYTDGLTDLPHPAIRPRSRWSTSSPTSCRAGPHTRSPTRSAAQPTRRRRPTTAPTTSPSSS